MSKPLITHDFPALRGLLDWLDEALLTVDATGRLLDANAKALALLGMDRDTLQQDHAMLATHIPGEHRLLERRAREAALQHGHSQPFETTLGGEVIRLRFQSLPQDHHLLAIGMPLEGAPRSTQESSGAALPFQAIAEMAAIGLSVFGCSGKTYWANQAKAAMLGLRREELYDPRNHPLRAILPNRRPENITETTIEPFLGRWLELAMHRPDGKTVEFRAHITRLPRQVQWDENRYLLTAMDLSEVHQIQETRQETERYYCMIFHRANEGLVVINQEGRIYDTNDALLRLIGYSRQQVLQPGFRGGQMLFSDTEKAKRAQAIQQALRTKNPVAIDTFLVHRDGQEIPVHISYSLLERLPSWDEDRLMLTVHDRSASMAAQRRETFLLEAIQQGVGEAARVLSAFAGGDLTVTMQTSFQDELVPLAEAITALHDRLGQVIRAIQRAAAVVSDAVRDLAHGNHNLSERTQRQAANLEEISSSMSELTAALNRTAGHMKSTASLAGEMRTASEQGAQAVKDTIVAMERIDQASHKISEIIGVIDEIAFQTNLLALNAAVEAARAGEHGRGFAVVAQEVRNLAQRSASGAKEIKKLITESLQRVGEGNRLTVASRDRLDEIQRVVHRVSTLVDEAAAVSDEQSRSLEQVNHAVADLSQATAENAGLVEQQTEGSLVLSRETDELQRLVTSFQMQPAQATKAIARKPAMPESIKHPAALTRGPADPKSTAAKGSSVPRLEPRQVPGQLPHLQDDNKRKAPGPTMSGDGWEDF